MKSRHKLLIYKSALIGVALILMLFPGVADKMPQIDSRIMVTSIGIDSSEEELELTAALTVPSGSGGKESAASVKGKSLGEAMNELSRAIGKRVELAHCALVALGRELCEKGVKDEIGYLISTGGISDGASLVVADGKAKELIETAAGLSEGAAFSLGSFISFVSEDAQIPMVSIVRFAANSGNIGASAYLPILKMGGGQKESQGGGQGGSGSDRGGSGEQGESQSGSQGGGQGGSGSDRGGSGEQGGKQSGGQGDEAQISSSEKTLIFKDYRAVGEFDEEATFALTWLDPESDRGIINLKEFKMDEHDLGQLTFYMRQKSVKVKAKFESGVPTVTVSLKAHLQPHNDNRISEMQSKGYKVHDVAVEVKAALEKQLSEQFENGWKKAKQMRADPFRFGGTLFKNAPKKYDETLKDPDDIFSVMTLKTDINILLV